MGPLSVVMFTTSLIAGWTASFICTICSARRNASPVAGASSILGAFINLGASVGQARLLRAFALSLLFWLLSTLVPGLTGMAALGFASGVVGLLLQLNFSLIFAGKNRSSSSSVVKTTSPYDYGLDNFAEIDADGDGLIVRSDLEWHRRGKKLGAEETQAITFLSANIERIGSWLGSHHVDSSAHRLKYRTAPTVLRLYGITREDLATARSLQPR